MSERKESGSPLLPHNPPLFYTRLLMAGNYFNGIAPITPFGPHISKRQQHPTLFSRMKMCFRWGCCHCHPRAGSQAMGAHPPALERGIPGKALLVGACHKGSLLPFYRAICLKKAKAWCCINSNLKGPAGRNIGLSTGDCNHSLCGPLPTPSFS